MMGDGCLFEEKRRSNLFDLWKYAQQIASFGVTFHLALLTFYFLPGSFKTISKQNQVFQGGFLSGRKQQN